jgi:hypothetical protein
MLMHPTRKVAGQHEKLPATWPATFQRKTLYPDWFCDKKTELTATPHTAWEATRVLHKEIPIVHAQPFTGVKVAAKQSCRPPKIHVFLQRQLVRRGQRGASALFRG